MEPDGPGELMSAYAAEDRYLAARTDLNRSQTAQRRHRHNIPGRLARPRPSARRSSTEMVSASCSARTERGLTDRSAGIVDIAEIVVCLAGRLDNVTDRTGKSIPSFRGDSLALPARTSIRSSISRASTISQEPSRGQNRRSSGEAPSSPTRGNPIVEFDRTVRPRTESDPAPKPCCGVGGDQEGRVRDSCRGWPMPATNPSRSIGTARRVHPPQ